MKRSVLLAAAALASASLSSRICAATRTWTGLGDGATWEDPLNWDGGLTFPNNGDNLVFPTVPALAGTIDTLNPRVLGTLTFGATNAYTLNDAPLTLGGAFTQNGAGAVTINTDVATGDAARTFGGTGAGVVMLNGVLSGAGLLTFNSGTWQLSNDQNTFTGGTTINLGARVELIGNTTSTPNVAFHGSAGASSQLGVGDGGVVTINGGTLKLTTIFDAGNNIAGNITLGRPVTFGSSGGTLDITNTVGGTLGGGIVVDINGRSVGGGGGDLALTLTGPGIAVIKWNGGERGDSTNDPANGDLQTGGNALRTASITGGSATTPIRYEVSHGALMEIGASFNTLAAPVTFRGQPGGNSSLSGVSTNVGRAQLTAGTTNVAGLTNAYTFAAGITFEDAFQVSLANGTRGIDGNVTIAGTAGGHAGDVAFSGRGTGTAVGTNHTNALVVGAFGPAGTNRTVLIQSGGTLNLDNRIRTDQTFMHGVQINAQTVLQPDATLRFRTSFVRTADTNNVSYVEVLGPVIASGTTGHDAVIDVTLPVRGEGDQPTNFGGYSMGDAPGGAQLIVNGSGFGGLTLLGRPHLGKAYAVNNPTNEASLPTFLDGVSNVNHLLGETGTQTNRAVAAPGRLMTLTGSGGFLAIGAQGETFPFPAGGEWATGVPVGLRTFNSNTSGADVSLPAGSTWHHNLHIEPQANLVAAGVTLSGATLSGKGILTSGVGASGFSLGVGSTLAPGAGDAGVFESDGDIAFLPNSTFAVDLKGPAAGTGYDQLNEVGSVTLTGSPALVATLGYDPGPSDVLAIIRNDGTDAVSGTFAGLPEGASLQLTNPASGNSFTFKITYVGNVDGGAVGNDVVLTAVPEPGTLGMIAIGGAGLLLRRRRRRSSAPQ